MDKHGEKIQKWNETYLLPYLHYSDQWISYENEESLKLKV